MKAKPSQPKQRRISINVTELSTDSSNFRLCGNLDLQVLLAKMNTKFILILGALSPSGYWTHLYPRYPHGSVMGPDTLLTVSTSP